MGSVLGWGERCWNYTHVWGKLRGAGCRFEGLKVARFEGCRFESCKGEGYRFEGLKVCRLKVEGWVRVKWER